MQYFLKHLHLRPNVSRCRGQIDNDSWAVLTLKIPKGESKHIWLKEAIEKKEKYIFKLHHFHIITIKMRTHESNEACMGYSSFS